MHIDGRRIRWPAVRSASSWPVRIAAARAHALHCQLTSQYRCYLFYFYILHRLSARTVAQDSAHASSIEGTDSQEQLPVHTYRYFATDSQFELWFHYDGFFHYL